ncbi:MAG: LysR substrate-binding domain-containing protein [Betaproteobacteria bacterium]
MSDLSALHDMTLFVEVARARNFSVAGRQLGVPVATLSRRIAAMESEFGVRLFDRTTRRVELAEAGARYFERCAHLADEARLAQESLRDTATRPSGYLRLSMPVDLGVHIVGPLLPEFARQFPGITLDLDLSSRTADLVGDHVDVAIRLGEVKGDQLVARRIAAVERVLFASPTYLDLRGEPASPTDLVEHDCLLVRAPRRQAAWRLERDGATIDVTVRGRWMLNNQGLTRTLVERGMGIGVLTPDLARDALAAGRLVRVLPQWAMQPLPIHAVTASRLQPASAKVFIEFLRQRLAGTRIP